MKALTKAATPLGCLGETNEIANAALFLVSDESSDLNGSELSWMVRSNPTRHG